MSFQSSDETHRNLVARIPDATGRDLSEWFHLIDDGPSFLRQDERARWLSGEYGLAHQYASAIIHEQDVRRANRSFE